MFLCFPIRLARAPALALALVLVLVFVFACARAFLFCGVFLLLFLFVLSLGSVSSLTFLACFFVLVSSFAVSFLLFSVSSCQVMYLFFQ